MLGPEFLVGVTSRIDFGSVKPDFKDRWRNKSLLPSSLRLSHIPQNIKIDFLS